MAARTGSNRALNAKQRRFVDIYLGRVAEHQDAAGIVSRSYISAGYSATSAQSEAYRLFRDPRIQQVIAGEESRRRNFGDVHVADIERELASLGFVRVTDLLDPETGELRPDLTPEQQAAIKEYEITQLPGGRKRVRIKLYDRKLEALVHLGKHKGMWPDKFRGTMTVIGSADAIAAAHFGLDPDEYLRRKGEGSLPDVPPPPGAGERPARVH